LPTKPEYISGTAGLSRGASIMSLRDVEVHYQLRGGSLARLLGLDTGTVKAVDGVSLDLHKGEVLGVVGESGSGKTTLGRALLGLVAATKGTIEYDGKDLASLSDKKLRALRRDLQMVFQDPHAALNPSMDIETAVGHPLRIHGLASGDDLRRQVAEALERVGLAPAERFLGKNPSDLSGGQKQRAVLARAIILDPVLLVADEPVSALDMSVRAKILQLMLDLKSDLDLTYVYITHDLASAKFFCDRVAIMYLGRVVEIGPTEEIFADPKHPYTKSLLKAIPEPDPDKSVPRDLPRGEIPDAASPPLGCSFHPRCPAAFDRCGWESRDLKALIEGHWLERGEDVFEDEQTVVTSLDDLDQPTHEALLKAGKSVSPGDVARLLEEIRADDPEEPLWRGVRSQDEVADGVRVDFHDGEDPRLRPAGGVEVACHLY
jgi:peptide/nickel transport system ATP-binding protein